MNSNRFRIIDGYPEHFFWYEHVDQGKISDANKSAKGTSVSSCLAITLQDINQEIGNLANLNGIDKYDRDFKTDTVIDVMIQRLGTKGERFKLDL